MARQPKSDFDLLDLKLTAVFVAPPLLWFGHLNLVYSLVPSSCAAENRAALHLATALAVVLTLAAGSLAWRLYRRMGKGSLDAGPVGSTRQRFMAASGAVYGVAFTLAVVANEIPVLILRNCG